MYDFLSSNLHNFIIADNKYLLGEFPNSIFDSNCHVRNTILHVFPLNYDQKTVGSVEKHLQYYTKSYFLTKFTQYENNRYKNFVW